MKKAWKIIINCIIVVATLFIMGFAAEASLRLVGYQMVKTPFSWFRDGGLYKIDSELFYRTQPNYINNFTKEYTNELGMKIQNTADQHVNKSTRALIVLGDSFVWGETVQRDTYPQQLQNMLDKLNIQMKVYNVGISGYGTDQEYMYFTRHVLPNTHPDIVIWNINLNDIADNIYTPLYDIHEDKLVQIPLWTNGVYITARLSLIIPGSIKRESRLMNLILRVLERVRLHKVTNQNYQQWSLEKIRLEIRQMKDLAQKYGFLLFIASDPMQCVVEKLDCELYAQKEIEAIKGLADDKDYFIDQTEHLMSSTFSGKLYLDESDVFPKGWWHPNVHGNFLMAESVIEKLETYKTSSYLP